MPLSHFQLSKMSEALESAILSAVESADIANTWDWAAASSVEHTAVVGTMKSLEVDGYVVSSPIHTEYWQLTEEAEGYVTKGSPEAQVFAAIAAEGSDDASLKAAVGDELLKIGIGKCMKNKWISKDKASGKYLKHVAAIDKDELVEQLSAVKAGSGAAVGDAALLKALKTRQLIVLV